MPTDKTTAEQLGQAHTELANIDLKISELDEIARETKEPEDAIKLGREIIRRAKQLQLVSALTRLQGVEAENERLRKGIIAVEDLIEQSYGVAGLHYNDDDAPWSDLLAGGRYEEWLLDYSAALASTKSKQEGAG